MLLRFLHIWEKILRRVEWLHITNHLILYIQFIPYFLMDTTSIGANRNLDKPATLASSTLVEIYIGKFYRYRIWIPCTSCWVFFFSRHNLSITYRYAFRVDYVPEKLQTTGREDRLHLYLNHSRWKNAWIRNFHKIISSKWNPKNSVYRISIPRD